MPDEQLHRKQASIVDVGDLDSVCVFLARSFFPRYDAVEIELLMFFFPRLDEDEYFRSGIEVSRRLYLDSFCADIDAYSVEHRFLGELDFNRLGDSEPGMGATFFLVHDRSPEWARGTMVYDRIGKVKPPVNKKRRCHR